MTYHKGRYQVLTMRVTEEEKAELRRMADAECRSLNNLLYAIIRQELDIVHEKKILEQAKHLGVSADQ